MSLDNLRATWYRKLREGGFRDIEQADGTLRDRNRLQYAANLDPIVRRATAEYFALAARYLAEGLFVCGEDQRVWELHADGLTVREIAKTVGRASSWVQRRITRYRRRALAARTADISVDLTASL